MAIKSKMHLFFLIQYIQGGKAAVDIHVYSKKQDSSGVVRELQALI